MFGITASISLLLLALSKLVFSSPCVAFDINDNLLAFGLAGKDWNAGTQNGWTTATNATDITTTGRPPFDGNATTCYLAQFFNAIYVLNGDSADPSAIYIYDAAAKSWSKQSVTVGTFDPNSFRAVLDHDTNVFYALSNGELYSLNMASMTSANSTALPWNDVQKSPFIPNGNDPVMVLADNHVYFLDVQNVPAGQAQIYVIHYDYFQPQAQSYPSAGSGKPFPVIHGQATSLFQTTGVQQEFAFMPDDFSGTYVVNVLTNTTQVLAPPASKDTSAFYFAGITSMVEMNSTGSVSYLPYTQGNVAANTAATWSPVKALSAIAASAPAATQKPSGSPSGTASSAGTTVTSKPTSGAMQQSRASNCILVVACLVAMARLL